MKNKFKYLSALALLCLFGAAGAVAQTEVAAFGFDSGWDYTTDSEVGTGLDASGTSGVVGSSLADGGWTVSSDQWARVVTMQYGSPTIYTNSVKAPTAGYDGSSDGGCLMIGGAWAASVSIKRAVNIANEGRYEVVLAYYNGNSSATGISANLIGMYDVNGKALAKSSLTSFTSNTWVTDTISFTVTDADDDEAYLQIGLTTFNSSTGGNVQLAVDYVKVLYYGVDTSELEELIAEATALYEGNTTSGGVALKAAIDEAQTLVDAGFTSQTAIATAVSALELAMFNYAVADASSDAPVEITDYFILDPSFEEQNTSAWSISGQGFWSSAGYQNNKDANCTILDQEIYVEVWSSSALGECGFNVEQTITLPAGYYRLTAGAMNVDQSDYDAVQTGVYLFAGDTQTEVNVRGTYAVEFSLTEESDVTIGVTSDDVTGQWVAIDNFQLYYLGDYYYYFYNKLYGNYLYMSGDETGDASYVADLDTDDSHYLWKMVANSDGSYSIKNVGSGLYLGSCATSTSVPAVEEANAVAYSWTLSPTYSGYDVLLDTSLGGSYNYLHATTKGIVGWSTAAEATQWALVPASTEGLAQFEANLEIADDLAEAMSTAETYQAGLSMTALITSSSQLYANFIEGTEGSLAKLLDGNATTFFHSTWWAEASTGSSWDSYHDLFVTVEGNAATDFQVNYTARNNNNRPTTIIVYASNAADAISNSTASGEDWTEITTLTTSDGLGEASGSFTFSTGETAYTYFRFAVTETSSGNAFFTYSEFQMYDPNPTYTATDETTGALTAAIDAASDISIGRDDYTSPLEALKAANYALAEENDLYQADLVALIAEVQAFVDAYDVEGVPGYLSTASATALTAAIAAAQTVADDEATGTAEALAAIEALKEVYEANQTGTVDEYSAYMSTYFTITNSRGSITYDADKAGDDNYIWYTSDVDDTDYNDLWGFYPLTDSTYVLYNVGAQLFAAVASVGGYGESWVLSETPVAINLEAMDDIPYVHITDANGSTMSISTGYTGPIITYYASGDTGVPFTFAASSVTIDDDVTAAIKALLYEPVDVTDYFILDPSFEEQNTSAWTISGTGQWSSAGYQNNKDANCTILDQEIYVEVWRNSALGECGFNVEQTITLPAGYYRLTAGAMNVDQSDYDAVQTGVYLFAGDAQTEVNVRGTYAVEFSLAEESDVTIGVTSDDVTGQWVAIDNFHLYCLDAETYSACQEKLQAVADAEEVLTYADIVGYPKSTGDAYAALAELTASAAAATAADIAAAIETYKSDTDVTLPEDGKAYTIKMVNSAGETANFVYTEDELTLEADATGDATVFICHELEDGVFMFAMPSGKYLVWRHSATASNSGTNGNVGYVNSYDETYCPLTVESMVANYNSYCTAASSASDFFGCLAMKGMRTNGVTAYYVVKDDFSAWDGASAVFFNGGYTSAMMIEETDWTYNQPALAAADDSLYGTLYLPFATTIPDGVNAYTATVNNDSELELAAITDGILPANTAALLVAEGTADTSFLFVPSTEAGTEVASNDLAGTMEADTDVSGYTMLTLSLTEDEPGFYVSDETTMPVAKACVLLDADSDITSLLFTYASSSATVDGDCYYLINARSSNFASSTLATGFSDEAMIVLSQTSEAGSTCLWQFVLIDGATDLSEGAYMYNTATGKFLSGVTDSDDFAPIDQVSFVDDVADAVVWYILPYTYSDYEGYVITSSSSVSAASDAYDAWNDEWGYGQTISGWVPDDDGSIWYVYTVEEYDGYISGIASAAVDADADTTLVDVYTLEGRLVRKGVAKANALDGLDAGAYIVGGEKRLKK